MALIGVDFGGTLIKGGRVDGKTVTHRAECPTQASDGPVAILDAVASVVGQVAGEADAVGLAIPGEADETGRCFRLPNVPGFEGLNIAEELKRRLGCPVAVENDGIAAAHAELRHGHGLEHPNFLLVTLGTGIGGGLCLDGQVRRGRWGFAAEIGHVLHDSTAAAPACGCGMRGCMEAAAGTEALQRAHVQAGGEAGLSPKDIAEQARNGDEAGKQAYQHVGEALGVGLAGIQNVLDLDALVFTGGIAGAFDLIEGPLRASLRSRAFAPQLAEIPFLMSALGGVAGIVGAAILAEGVV